MQERHTPHESVLNKTLVHLIRYINASLQHHPAQQDGPHQKAGAKNTSS